MTAVGIVGAAAWLTGGGTWPVLEARWRVMRSVIYDVEEDCRS